MGETLVRKRNIDLYAKEETTAGTLITNTATDAIRLTEDDLDLNLNRDLLDPAYLTSSLGTSAPQAGMWADDLGGQVGFFARGGSSSPRPDSNVLLKCLFGAENSQAADTIKTGTLTTDEFTVTAEGNHTVGNLIRAQTDTSVFSIARVLTLPGSDIMTVWPPLTETPANLDPIQAAYSYVLADTGHPTMSMFAYMEGTKRLAYAGCRPRSLTMTFEVGQRIPMIFSFSGLTPYRDYTADPVAPTYQTSPNPLIVLGIGVTFTYAIACTGTPTTTETKLNTPYFEVAVGDDIIVDGGSGVYETANISAVSGDAGDAEVTLTHGTLAGGAATTTETVYIKRNTDCATMGASFDLTLEYEWLPINCITASYGKLASEYGKRTISMNKNAYFRSWEEYMKRDNVVGAELMVIAGDTANNIMALYAPNVINTEPSLAFDELVMNPTAMQAVRGTMSGNESELTLAYF